MAFLDPTLYPPMPRTPGNCFPCVQLNMHCAQNAYTELLSLLNDTPDALCLLQEPYLVRDRLPRPRGFDVFPSAHINARTTVYSSRSLKAQEISHLCTRDCTVIQLNCGSRNTIVASVYLDIMLPIAPDWLENILQYVE